MLEEREFVADVFELFNQYLRFFSMKVFTMDPKTPTKMALHPEEKFVRLFIVVNSNISAKRVFSGASTGCEPGFKNLCFSKVH